MWRCIFGPVLFYDLLHTARRGRHLLFRVLYAAVLVGLLFLLYSEEVGKRGGGLWQDWRVPQTQRLEVLRFNEAFFTRFTLVQFALILLLTPGVTAGAIADEKERKTLEFLLTTELRGYEIVLGKLAARLAYMFLLVLTGLPVLALLQLLGGVDPQLILASFIASGLTLLSIACLSICNSVLAAKPRTAIFAAYVEVLAYFAISLLLMELSEPGAIPEAVEWFCAGNPYLALQDLMKVMQTTGTLSSGLSSILVRYLSFHAMVAVLSLAGALLGLRVWNRHLASQGSRRAFVVLLKPKRLPPVGKRPVLWKELYAAPFLHVKRGGLIVFTSLWIVGLFLGGLLLTAELVIYFVAKNPRTADFGAPGLALNLRRLSVAIGCLSAVGAAIHSAGAFAGERDRQTFDSLLATPLTNRAIVMAKWWGGFLSVRKAWYCLIAIWLVCVLTKLTDPLAVPVMAVACLVYAGFATSVGLWCSLVCRTTLRAMFWTLLVLILAYGGHQVLVWFIEPLVSIHEPRFGRTAFRHPAWFQSLVEFQTYGLTPHQTLNYLASTADVGQPDEPIDWSSTRMRFLIDDCASGLVAYAFVAAFLLYGVQRRFAKATGRMPMPERDRRMIEVLPTRAQWNRAESPRQL